MRKASSSLNTSKVRPASNHRAGTGTPLTTTYRCSPFHLVHVYLGTSPLEHLSCNTAQQPRYWSEFVVTSLLGISKAISPLTNDCLERNVIGLYLKLRGPDGYQHVTCAAMYRGLHQESIKKEDRQEVGRYDRCGLEASHSFWLPSDYPLSTLRLDPSQELTTFQLPRLSDSIFTPEHTWLCLNARTNCRYNKLFHAGLLS